jgi:hypothetical protein
MAKSATDDRRKVFIVSSAANIDLMWRANSYSVLTNDAEKSAQAFLPVSIQKIAAELLSRQ